MEGMVNIDDYLRVQEQLKQRIKSLEAALAINNSLTKLLESENKALQEQLGHPTKIIINSDLVEKIEKTLDQLLIDIPIKDLSKKEIKEALEELLVTIETESKQGWKFGLDFGNID